MATTRTKPRPTPRQEPPTIEHDPHEGQPEAQTIAPPAPEQKVTIYGEFERQFEARVPELKSMLPSNVPVPRFIDTVKAAVRANTDLLTNCDRRLLFGEIVKAARDGLLPDGKEGAIVVRKGKPGWQPMVHGVRKRAKELDGIIIDTQLVHENDAFTWKGGDDAKIEHEPLLPWKGKRGKEVGVYAIVRRFHEGHEEILHRDVMGEAQVEAVREYSMQKSAAMWTTLKSEGWRKTIVHRVMKSVPCSPALREIIDRTNDDFEFEKRPFAPRVDANVPMPPAISGAATVATPPDATDEPATAPTAPAPAGINAAAFIADLGRALVAAETMDELNDAWEANEVVVEKRLSKPERDRCFGLYTDAEIRIKGAK